ncbi:MAG TPA: MATE family efflux transporter [Labilithrix sp.]|nr:MATE family efflux transporter [Labilithrix sp.]
MVVSTSPNAESLEEGSEEERLKRQVAHGPRIVANAKTDAAGEAQDVDRMAEGRPRRSGNRFSVRNDSRVAREVFDLAWPIAAAMLGETAIGLVDTKLVGGLGAAALGGVGLATVLMFLAYSLSYGAMRGVKIRVAHAIGEGRHRDGFAYTRAGFAMGGAFGVLVLLVCRDVGPLLVKLDADPEIIPYARDFLAAVTLGAPATCALAALIQRCQATGDSRTPMIVGITGNAFNALFAWALIYGHFGLPALGVRGGGYATATTEMMELAVMLTLFLREERRARATDSPGSATLPFARAVRDVADLGLPTGIQFAAETLAFTAFTVVLGSISKEEIAAHQIALNVIRVSFLPGVAVSEATSVLVGQALGGRRLDRADMVVRSGLGIGVGFMAACGVLFALFGGMLGRFFSADPVVVANARTLLFVAAVFQVLDAVNIVLRGALRGAKDQRAVMFIGVLVVWSFLPTSAYVLGKLCGLGALGGWLGFVGETTIGATLFWLRWKRGGWRKDYG